MNKKKKWGFFILTLCLSVLCACMPAGRAHESEAAKKNKAVRPKLTVSINEVSLENARLEKDHHGVMKYFARVRNKSDSGTVRKIEYTFTITAKNGAGAVETGAVEQADGQKQVTLTAKNIKPGKVSGEVSCEGDVSGQLSGMRLGSIRLYAGTAVYVYDAVKKKGKIFWGTKDKKSPVIRGWLGKKSSHAGEVYRICYSDQRDTFDFTKYVRATDDRDGEVKVRVDKSRINWKKNGVYKVFYTASDRAGNKTRAWAFVQVIVPGTAEDMADQVLKGITKKNWADEKKARAIYRYVRAHCSYISSSSHDPWRNTAIQGLRYHSGDCYTFYSVSKLLLTRAGLPNIIVSRHPVYHGMRHFWNMVYVRGGWYHFDSTPRSGTRGRNANFCLLTDAQLKIYSTDYIFKFRGSSYPARAKKKISPDP